MRDHYEITGDNPRITVNNGPQPGELVDPAGWPLDVTSPSLSEFDLVVARHRVVPYVATTRDDGRLEELTAWCRDDTDGRPRVRARLVTGGAGSGKTRLAAELCLTVTEPDTDWMAGFATTDRAALAGPLPKQPLLIVFDYTELNTDIARDFLQRVVKVERRNGLSHPVRVLLVARSEGEWLKNLSGSAAVKKLLRHHPPVELTTQDFDRSARRAHRDAAFARFTQPDMHPADDAVPPDVDGNGYDTPLMVHIATLLAAKGEDLPSPDSDALRSELLDDLIDREIDHLSDSLADSPGIGWTDVRTALAIATLTTPTPDEAVGLLPADPRWGNRSPESRQRVADLIRSRHQGSTMEGQDGVVRTPIAPIEPDLVSEHLVATLDNRTPVITKLFTHDDLRPEHRARLLSLLALTGDHYPEVRNDFNAHLADNLKQLVDDSLAARSLHELLTERLPQLLHTAVDLADAHRKYEAATQLATALEQFSGDPEISRVAANTGVKVRYPHRYLAGLAIAYHRHQVNHYRRDGDVLTLAAVLNVFSVRLNEVGRREEGVAAAEEAANILRELAKTAPEIHNPILAGTLTNLAGRLGEVGRPEEGVAAAEEAADIYRNLTESHPYTSTSNHTWKVELATILNNLAIRLYELSRWTEGLAAAQEAVDLYRSVVESIPDAYKPALAQALTNLATALEKLGCTEESLAAAQEAVDIFRPLAQTHPAAYNPDLALALGNLSRKLANVNRREEALTTAREAVRIRRKLAQTHPNVYTPALAQALDVLATALRELGRTGESLAAAQEAVDLYRSVVESSPAAYNPDLANTLTSLSQQLAAIGHDDESLTAVQEAVDIYRSLAQIHPAVYNPNLSVALHNLSIRLANVNRREEALTTAREAVRIRRELAQTHPDTYNPALANTLTSLSQQLAAIGHDDESLTAVQEAVDIYRLLTQTHPFRFSSALIQLSIQLAKVGRWEESQAAIKQSMLVGRRLFKGM